MSGEHMAERPGIGELGKGSKSFVW